MDYPFHPLAAAYPLLEGADFEAFKASVAEHGLEKPIYVWNDQIIDGRNRFRACKEAGISPEFYDCSDEVTEDKLPELLRVLNEDRRHLTPDFISARRRERMQRIAAARKAGQKFEDIATAEGIALSQAYRDHQDSVFPPPGKTENEPESSESSTLPDQKPTTQQAATAPATVTGKDGKQYPARKRKSDGTSAGKTPRAQGAGKKAAADTNGKPAAKAPAKGKVDANGEVAPATGHEDAGDQASATPPPGAESLPELEIIRPEPPDEDGLGLPLPEHMREAFAVRGLALEAQRLARQLGRYCDRIAKEPGGFEFASAQKLIQQKNGVRYQNQHLRALLSDLASLLPYASVCPWCHRENPGRVAPKCRGCGGKGWITRQGWDLAPKPDQDAVLALVPDARQEA